MDTRRALSRTPQARLSLGDSLPEAGNLQQSVLEALQQLLAGKQVVAKLSTRVTDAMPGQPLRTVHYRVDSPDIRIRSFKLDNVSPALSPQVDKLAASLIGSPYNEATTSRRILDIYRNSGYLDASFEYLTRAIANPATSRIDLDISASVKPGETYRVAKIVWTGSPQIGEKEFVDACKLHPGDPASPQLLHTSLAVIDAAYRSQGYMDVSVDAASQLDTASHLVTYTVAVNSGAQYHLSEVQVLNLSPEARNKFDAAWKLKPGDLYDETYLATFIKSNIAQPYLQPYSLTYRAERSPDTHLVKLLFIFARAR